MMLDLVDLVRKHDLKITGILHAGARLAEEAPQYRAAGVENVWWVEANPEVIPDLTRVASQYGHHVVEALLYDEDGVELVFNVTNERGLSSSILEFGTHRQFSPDMVFERRLPMATRTIDSLVAEHGITGCNMLVMDLQGAELTCLRGAKAFVEQADVVVSEINKDEVYVGCAKIWQLDEFLAPYGLVRVETYWVGNQGWGDAAWRKPR